MIKLHELNPLTRGWVEALPDQEQVLVLDLATDIMVEIEKRTGASLIRPRLGANGSVELVIKMILLCNERGTVHE